MSRRKSSKARRRWGIIAGIAGGSLVLLLLAATLAAALVSGHFASGDTLAPNLFVGGVPVGGLSAAEARQALATALATAQQQ